jgi:hypothetical protein
MPVIPVGLESFEIQPPITAHDDGRSSDNLLHDAQRVFNLIQDERHLTAEDLLNSVLRRVDESTRTADPITHHSLNGLLHRKAARIAKAARERAQKEITQVQKLLESKAATIDKLRVRHSILVNSADIPI